MKKIVLFLLLFSSLYSDATIYAGLNHGYYNENFTDIDAKSSNTASTLKVGYGDIKAYAVELSIQNLKNTANIFSNNDSNKHAININLVKAFDFELFAIPFFKAGMGAGLFNIDGQFQDKLHYSSFNLGLGLFIPIGEHLDIELSFMQKYMTYEGVDTIIKDVSYKSTMNITNLGFNIRF